MGAAGVACPTSCDLRGGAGGARDLRPARPGRRSAVGGAHAPERAARSLRAPSGRYSARGSQRTRGGASALRAAAASLGSCRGICPELLRGPLLVYSDSCVATTRARERPSCAVSRVARARVRTAGQKEGRSRQDKPLARGARQPPGATQLQLLSLERSTGLPGAFHWGPAGACTGGVLGRKLVPIAISMSALAPRSAGPLRSRHPALTKFCGEERKSAGDSLNPFPAPGRASMIASPTRSSPSDRTCPKHHAHMS